MKFASHSRGVLVALLAASAAAGCGKKGEDEARVPPAPAQQAAEGPIPVPGRPGAVSGPSDKTHPQTPHVTLAEVLAKDAEKWAATAGEREASRKKLAESEAKLAEAVRRRVPKGLMLPSYVLGDIDLYRKSPTRLSYGFLKD